MRKVQGPVHRYGAMSKRTIDNRRRSVEDNEWESDRRQRRRIHTKTGHIFRCSVQQLVAVKLRVSLMLVSVASTVVSTECVRPLSASISSHMVD